MGTPVWKGGEGGNGYVCVERRSQRVRVTGSGATRGTPVLNAARQRGSNGGLCAVDRRRVERWACLCGKEGCLCGKEGRGGLGVSVWKGGEGTRHGRVCVERGR
eukprot:213665-Chlamydomonas_euryale.AAC.2